MPSKHKSGSSTSYSRSCQRGSCDDREKRGSSRSGSKSHQHRSCYVDEKPYMPAEKDWIKDNWESEYKLLRDYDLSIYDEDDRAEGRAIVREYMRRDAESNLESSPEKYYDFTSEKSSDSDESPFEEESGDSDERSSEEEDSLSDSEEGYSSYYSEEEYSSPSSDEEYSSSYYDEDE